MSHDITRGDKKWVTTSQDDVIKTVVARRKFGRGGDGAFQATSLLKEPHIYHAIEI